MNTLKEHALVCPHCGLGFMRRLKLQGTTSCPRCTQRFDRAKAVVTGPLASDIRSGRIRKRQARGASLLHEKRTGGVIRGDQAPTSIAEARFKARAFDKGWKPHRPSWPDFLVETADGLIAVEVKGRGDSVSPEQRATFTLLEQAGIAVYLWRDTKDARDVLTRWYPALDLRTPAP